jgi:hypothetical protein
MKFSIILSLYLLILSSPSFGSCWFDLHSTRINAARNSQLNVEDPYLFEIPDSLKAKLREFLENHQYSKRSLAEHQKSVTNLVQTMHEIYDRVHVVRAVGEVFAVNQTNYKVVRILGHGAEAVAYEVVDPAGNTYALKHFFFKDLFEDAVETAKFVDDEPIPFVRMIELDKEENIMVNQMARGVTLDKIVEDDSGFFTYEEKKLVTNLFYEMQALSKHTNIYEAESYNSVINTTTWRLLLFDPI